GVYLVGVIIGVPYVGYKVKFDERATLVAKTEKVSISDPK
ncbi:uncharacterized protein METZ01_LOCUS276292, partial [marine metagenome]